MGAQTEVMEWRGCEVVDRDGDKIGKLDEIYLDRQTGEPEWAIVNTGLFGRRSSFVPLKGAMREGDMIRVAYDSDRIKDAPSVDADGELSQEEEQQVYAHYGLDYSQERSQTGLPDGGVETGSDEVAQPTAGSDDDEGQLRLRRFVREEVVIDEESGETVREERVTTNQPGQDS